MAAAAAGKPVTLLGRVSALRPPRPGARTRSAASRLAAAAREHLATLAGLAAIDLGCFEASRPAGWIAVGMSVLLAEWKIRE